MSIDPAILRAMAEAGASTEVILAAVEAAHAKEQEKLAEKRAKDAARQRKSRANRELSRDVTVTGRDNCDSGEEQKNVPPHPPIEHTSTNPPCSSNKAPKGASRHSGRTLPEDWEAKESHAQQAEGRGYDAEFVRRQVVSMRNWAEGNRNRAIARKADWDRTFANWLDRAMDEADRRKPRSFGPEPPNPDQTRQNVFAILEARKAQRAAR